jgi:hypothetical protein
MMPRKSQVFYGLPRKEAKFKKANSLLVYYLPF